MLYRNNGNGTFTDVTAEAGVAARRMERERRLLRLRQRRPARPVRRALRRLDASRTTASAASSKPGLPRPTAIPTTIKGVANAPLPQQRRRHVHRRVAKAGHRQPEGKGLGVAFADFDGDGSTDIFVANDTVQSFLYRNNGDGRFEDVGPRWPASASTRTAGLRRAWASTSPTTTTTAGPTSSSPTSRTRATRSTATTATARFTDVTHASGLGRATLLFSGWGTRLPRLRQRRLEGPLRRAGPRHRHDRADLAPPDATGSRRSAPERGRALRASREAGPAFADGVGGPRRGLRRPRQRRRRGHRRQQRRAERPSSRNDGGNRNNWLAHPARRHALEPRRPRMPGEGRLRDRPDAVLHRRKPRSAISRRATSDFWWALAARTTAALVEDSMAVGDCSDVRESAGASDAGRDRAGEVAATSGTKRIHRLHRFHRFSRGRIGRFSAATASGGCAHRRAALMARLQCASPRWHRPSWSGLRIVRTFKA